MIYKTYALGELVQIKYGKNQKKVLSEEGTIPIYGTGGLMGYATEALYDKPSVLIGRKGTIGKVRYVDHPFWTVDTLFYTIVNTELVLPKYLFYLMSQMDLNAYNEGTTIPSLRTETLNRLEFDIPSIEEQKEVLSYLEPIDDKIQLNTEINKNLEAQAMALINDYCASVIEKIALGKLMSLDNGYAFQSKTYLSSGKYRIITIKNVQDGKIDSQGAAYINEIPTRMKSNCFLSKSDVLLSLTGNVGRVGIVYEDNLLLNQRVAKICPFNNALLPWLYYYFRLPSTKVSLETIAKGTAQQNLSPVETLKLQIPFEMASANNLSQVLLTMFNMEISNFIESQQLSKLRDVLLPQLMSGELDVSDIDL